MVDQIPDETLVEVVLIDSAINDRSAVAFVVLVPHIAGEGSPTEKIGPVLVPANWFTELLPMSIFLDIPDDASSIAPSFQTVDASDVLDIREILVERGRDLAVRWRTNRRPIVTTIEFVADTFELAPAHLLNIALDAVAALEERDFTKSGRSHIATYCELMAAALSESTPPSPSAE